MGQRRGPPGHTGRFTALNAGEHSILDHSFYLAGCTNLDLDRLISIDPASMHLKVQQAYGESNRIGRLECYGGDGICGIGVNRDSDSRPPGETETGIFRLRIDEVRAIGLGSRRGERSPRGVKWGMTFQGAVDCTVGSLYIGHGHPDATAVYAAVAVLPPQNETDATVRGLAVEALAVDDPDIRWSKIEDPAAEVSIPAEPDAEIE